MEIKATLLPGQNGTKRHLREYGDRLVCVRYRYDPERARRYTTVELIVDEAPWAQGRVRKRQSTKVRVRIDFRETGLRERVKAAGGRWLPDAKLWELDYHAAARLRVLDRVEKE